MLKKTAETDEIHFLLERTGKDYIWKETHCVQNCILKVEFHHTKWLISWILPVNRSLTTALSRLRFTRTIYANTTFGDSDEIRIPIVGFVHVAVCFLYIEGRLTVKKKYDQMTTILGNNYVAFMFDEIWYQLNDVEIDYNRNVGITSTIKNCLLYVNNVVLIVPNAEWNSRFDMKEGYFNFCVPLNMLLGFCEDYKRDRQCSPRINFDTNDITITIAWWEILWRLNYSKCSDGCLTLR